ncbi:MAG: sensor histidine kinase [Stygiobacter sp.]
MNLNKIMNVEVDAKNLAKKLNNIREDEKARIARQIHDELGQILTTLKMDLTYLAEEIQLKDNVLFGKLVRIINLADDAINSARQISSELRVPLLDHLGLIAAIDWQIKEFEKRYNIICNKKIINEINLDKERAIIIFRIIQELLLNITKHSKATVINFEFNIENSFIKIHVEDNGIGFEQEEIHKPNSMGLINIFESIKLLDAKIFIDSKINHGTKIKIEIPLNDSKS